MSVALARIFPASQHRYSVFLIRTDEDLKRIVVGLNMFRDRPNDKVDFVAFTESEFETCAICVDKTLGQTECHSANSLHADIHSKDHRAFSQLGKEHPD